MQIYYGQKHKEKKLSLPQNQLLKELVFLWIFFAGLI